MPQEPQAAAATVRAADDANGATDADGHPEEQGSMSFPVKDTVLPTAEPATTSRDEAATMIQSAFRGFMARRQLQELKKSSENGGCTDEPRSPTSASVAASVEVQVGESLSNLRLSDDSAAAAVSAQHRSSQRSRPQAFRVKMTRGMAGGVGRQHGELERVKDADAEQDRGDDAAGAGAGLRLLAAAAELRRRRGRDEEAGGALRPGGVQRGVELAGAVDGDAAGVRGLGRRLHEQERGGLRRVGGRRVIVVRRRHDLAGGEKESYRSNDVSVVSFDGSSGSLSCYKPGSKSRLRGGGRSLPRRKVSSSDHRLHARSHKSFSKNGNIAASCSLTVPVVLSGCRCYDVDKELKELAAILSCNYYKAHMREKKIGKQCT
uniref:IQ calmodulin-binding motif family protein n=1 Tax=Oryza ridleyi TaxID=83308 RepID=C0JAC8_9ORYZ|nr:IQ calmodulin-binding motif family protein [Oryza ridleyi]